MFPVLACASNLVYVASRNRKSWLVDFASETPSVVEVSDSPTVGTGDSDANGTNPTQATDKTTRKNVDIDAKGVVLAAAINKSGSYLALCNDYKELLLYALGKSEDNQLTVKLLSTRVTAKKGVKIIFTGNEKDILVADKFGDVLSLSAADPAEEGRVILGHLSMLLDVCLVDEDRLIVTADRDEKIRVSHYPNTYNIETYCLGHEGFVTAIVEVSSRLVSSSADGTVRLWDTKDGALLSTYRCDGDDSFVCQLARRDSGSSGTDLFALEARSNRLLRLSVCQSDLRFVGYLELPSPVLAIAACCGGVLVFTDSATEPLRYVGAGERAVGVTRGLEAMNRRLAEHWQLFDGCLDSQRQHYSNLTKVSLESFQTPADEQPRKKAALAAADAADGDGKPEATER